MLDGISDRTTIPLSRTSADAPKPAAVDEKPAAEERKPASAEAQQSSRAIAAGRERAIAGVSRIPKLDANKPVMIVATQSGSADDNKIVKATDKYMKEQAAKNGFQVVDASNLSGDALKKFIGDVAKANPAAFANKNTILFTGGHGDIMTNEQGQDRHQIAATDENHKTKQVETVRDILKPVFDAIGGIQLSAFVSSCRSGEAAQDVSEVFGNNPNVGLLASSTRDQNSFGPGKEGIEQAAIAFAKTMSTSSQDRAQADANHDGTVTLGEFAKHWNEAHGGLGFVDPGESDRSTALTKRQQKLVVGGNRDLALVPNDAGATTDTSSEGLQDPAHAGPLQRDQLGAEAKRMQRELAQQSGRAPKIKPGFATVEETGSDGEKRALADGSEQFRNPDGVKETQHPDGSFDVTGLPGGDSVHFDKDGTRTDVHTRGLIAKQSVDPSTGHRETTYRSGVKEVRDADGSGYLEKNGKRTPLPVKSAPGALAKLPSAVPPDGDAKESKGPHGEHGETYDDGTKVTMSADGDRQTIAFPASTQNPIARATLDDAKHTETIELRDGPIASVTRPLDGAPGTTTTTYRDGTREVRSPDGRGYFVLPGGKRVPINIR